MGKLFAGDTKAEFKVAEHGTSKLWANIPVYETAIFDNSDDANHHAVELSAKTGYCLVKWYWVGHEDTAVVVQAGF